jgi:hypothetical protein
MHEADNPGSGDGQFQGWFQISKFHGKFQVFLNIQGGQKKRNIILPPP